MKRSGTFCYVFLYQTVGSGNQHGGREDDDLQNWPDMTSHEILYRSSTEGVRLLNGLACLAILLETYTPSVLRQ